MVPSILSLWKSWNNSMIVVCLCCIGATLGHLYLCQLVLWKKCPDPDSNPHLSNRSQASYRYSIEPLMVIIENRWTRFLVPLPWAGVVFCLRNTQRLNLNLGGYTRFRCHGRLPLCFDVSYFCTQSSYKTSGASCIYYHGIMCSLYLGQVRSGMTSWQLGFKHGCLHCCQ